MFNPKYTITPRIAKNLVDIEGLRQHLERLSLDPNTLDKLQNTSKVNACFHACQMAGHEVTKAQVAQAINHPDSLSVAERTRALEEARFYYQAMLEAEKMSTELTRIEEAQIKQLHALASSGKHSFSPYRTGQNTIRGNDNTTIVYWPPKPKEIPELMLSLVDWVNDMLARVELPMPLVAALAHYQILTIHPYFDSNYRTAALFTKLILKIGGHNLRGLYALEQYDHEYKEDYYHALAVDDKPNYDLGRADADVTQFIDYFVTTLLAAFKNAETQAKQSVMLSENDMLKTLRRLEPRQRQTLQLFKDQYKLTAEDIAKLFSLKPRSAQYLCSQWVDDGFLAVADASKKRRRYVLADPYESLLG